MIMINRLAPSRRAARSGESGAAVSSSWSRAWGRRLARALAAGCVTVALTACTTSPLGRKQLAFLPEEQLAQMGEMAYTNLKKETPVLDGNSSTDRYVSCVSRHIVQVLEGNSTQWEVTVFDDEQVNAFALPGGKIGVYTGLLDVAENQSQLAAVIGHEIAHVLADHSNERLSTNYAAQTGMALAGAALSDDPNAQRLVMGALGVGLQVGVLLPYSRTQETESDLIGLDLMAKAGFDPRESVSLWQNMSQAGGPKPPQFLSTHPSGDSRIKALRERMPQAMDLYRQAQASGRNPQCKR